VPYIVVTNLARTMRDLKDRGIWLIGADDSATESLYKAKLDGALAMVLGAEARGFAVSRRTAATCWCRSR
jgi:23S rRNA (guanosine2251-2'-O)-methyltransferase